MGGMYVESLEVLEMKLIIPLATSSCPNLFTDDTANTPTPPQPHPPRPCRAVAPSEWFPLPLLQQLPLECHPYVAISSASSSAPAWFLALVSRPDQSLPPLFYLQSPPPRFARR